ncbi:MAG: tRNA ((37)-N6)-dimethylallyltransferase MiaA [Bacteroidota bacterium]
MNFLVVIGGPTAAGKTALALDVARHFGCEIISADSRQFFRETEIGTAKPSSEELLAVPHHFINSLSIGESYDTARFEDDVLRHLEGAFLKNRIQVMAGGSGLYIEAVLNGLDPLPARNTELREELEKTLKEKGIESLQVILRDLDPEAASTLDMNNPSRLIRAIELCRLTGAPLSALRTGRQTTRNFIPVLIAVSPDREKLYRRIDRRVIQMMERGLLEEVKGLFEKRHLNALRTVGYSELFEHLEGKYTLEEAVRLIQQHTRNYAKRQLTWFRNRGEYTWFDPDDSEGVLRFISEKTAGRGH